MCEVNLAPGAVVFHPRGTYLLLDRQDERGSWLYDELRDRNGIPTPDGDESCCFGILTVDDIALLEPVESW